MSTSRRTPAPDGPRPFGDGPRRARPAGRAGGGPRDHDAPGDGPRGRSRSGVGGIGGGSRWVGGARPLPILVALAAALLVALALGVMGRVTSTTAFRGGWELSRLGGPWLVGAFGAGVLCARGRGAAGGASLGALGGAIAIAGGSLTYYAIYRWIEGTTTTYHAVVVGTGWAVAGLLVGGAVGALGAAAAIRGAPPAVRGAAIGTLGGLLVGEAAAVLIVWETRGLMAMALLEAACGAGLVILLGARRPLAWTASAVVALLLTATIAPALTTALRDALRTVGWGGV